MKVFARVAHHEGFAAAARELRISPAAVSKHVAALETRIGARLLDRTTRRVNLTEAGRVYLERCVECLQALDDADASVGMLSEAPRGILRVTAPVDFAHCLEAALAAVMQTNPDLTVDVQLSNRVVDLVDDGFDVAIRAAGALDGRYVARPIAQSRLLICGAPSYFARHGRPRRPEELPRHRWVVFDEPKPRDHLVFTRGRRKVKVAVRGVMTSNSGELVQGAVRAGVGLGMLPSFMAHRDIANRALEPVLVDWDLPEFRIFAVYPHRRFLSPKVRVFVEALRGQYGDGTGDPWAVSAPAPRGAAGAP
jgi:DNA-binding transcriptional LysR family regulator